LLCCSRNSPFSMNPRFYFMYTRTCYTTLSRTNWIQSTHSPPVSLGATFNIILHLCQVVPRNFFHTSFLINMLDTYQDHSVQYSICFCVSDDISLKKVEWAFKSVLYVTGISICIYFLSYFMLVLHLIRIYSVLIISTLII
jgi:hypothetical protein